MATNIRSSVLSEINDQLVTVEYGDGWLVQTPLTYSDGDTVSLFVEPFNGLFRVTDRAEAVDRLIDAHVDPDGGKAADGLTSARARFTPLGSDRYEVATCVDQSRLGASIFDVAVAALRIEQLRWLARDLPVVTFEDKIVERVSRVARAHSWAFTTRPKVALRRGRRKRITAAVHGPQGDAWIQAVGGSDRNRAVESCFYTFANGSVPRERRVAAVAGAASSWDSGLIGDLEEVGRVAFFEVPHDLERVIEEAAGIRQ